MAVACMQVVPELFLHATLNLEECVAVAVQCENDDPRIKLSTLNALVVHASSGARQKLGPCGQAWQSPWAGLDDEQAIEALGVLLRRQPEEVLTFVPPLPNRPKPLRPTDWSTHTASCPD